MSAPAFGAFEPTKERFGGGRNLARTSRGDDLDLSAAGSWTAEYARALEPLVDAAVRGKTAARSVAIDVTQIERIDTYGAWLIERTLRTWSSQGADARLVGLPDRHRGCSKKCMPAPTNVAAAAQAEPHRRDAGKRRPLDGVDRTDVLLLFQMGGALLVAFCAC